VIIWWSRDPVQRPRHHQSQRQQR